MDVKESKEIIEQFVDYVQPELVPYETSFYVYLLRNSLLKGMSSIRVGKRTIAFKCGKGTRSDKANFQHVTKILNSLEEKGCIKIGDTTREGTLYEVILPKEIPFVKEKMMTKSSTKEEDYFNDNEKRQELFERDKWKCHYCGEKVTKDNATLDHLTPQSKGGKNTKDNLKTSCLMCNSIKSGKTYEEAAPLILKSIKERKHRNRRKTAL